MKMVMISEEKLDELFERLREKLSLKQFEEKERGHILEHDAISLFYRAVNYHVCGLKDEIKKG